VLQTFVGDWNDLPSAKESALNQIDAGADIIWHSGDGIGLAILEACSERDITCLGNNADQSNVAPENTLCSFVYTWGPMFLQMIDESVEGTYGNKQYWIEFANNGVQIVWNDALSDLVTPEIMDKLDEAEQGFIDGSLDLGDLDAMTLE
jgi:basic membrane protein A